MQGEHHLPHQVMKSHHHCFQTPPYWSPPTQSHLPQRLDMNSAVHARMYGTVKQIITQCPWGGKQQERNTKK